MSTSKAQRLRRAVLSRRHELDLTQLELWMDGGPSNTTLTKIEAGEMDTLSRTTAKKLDAGLRWEAGSAKRVWDGGEPTPLIEGVSPENSAALRRYILEANLDPVKRDKLLQVLDDTA